MDSQIRRLFNQYQQSGDPALLCPLVFSLARLHSHLDAEGLTKLFPQLPRADVWDCLHSYPLGMTSYTLALFQQELEIRGFKQTSRLNEYGVEHPYPYSEISQLCFYSGDPSHTGLVHPPATTLQDDLSFRHAWAFKVIPQMSFSLVERHKTFLYYEHHPQRMANPYLMWGSVGVTDSYATPSNRVYFNPFVMTPVYAEKIFDMCHQMGVRAAIGVPEDRNNNNYVVVNPPDDLS